MRRRAGVRTFAHLLLAGATSGCFALFTLDGYGPSLASEDAGGLDDAEDDRSSADGGQAVTIAFVTSEEYSGALGGIDNADLRCQQLAERAGYSGKQFKAWLSDEEQSPSNWSSAAPDAAARPIVLADGQLVAGGFAELIDSGPRVPIAMTEQRTVLTSGSFGGGSSGNTLCPETGALVWTNTGARGTRTSPYECNAWRIADGKSLRRAGLPVAKDAGAAWTDGCTMPCSREAHLYCFEQQ
ncbi:MAG: surface antigen protein [Labilithrix sp.]|nr:surface antigen protein [Labilithrix sp.]